jgi:hypothetical protein
MQKESRCSKGCVSHKACLVTSINAPRCCQKCREPFLSNDSRLKRLDGLIVHTTCYEIKPLFELSTVYENLDELKYIYVEKNKVEKNESNKVRSSRKAGSS